MKHGSSPDKPIRLCVVACGDRSGETLVMLKSAVVFSHTYQLFHLFAEDHAKKELSEEVRQLSTNYSTVLPLIAFKYY